MATKKKKQKRKTPARPKAKAKTEPQGAKVYFIAEETRTFLLEYLQLSPAGSYAPATINNVVAALQNAGSGHVKPSAGGK